MVKTESKEKFSITSNYNSQFPGIGDMEKRAEFAPEAVPAQIKAPMMATEAPMFIPKTSSVPVSFKVPSNEFVPS